MNGLGYHGGKSLLAPKHIALFPSHVSYIEPYFGGGNVLLAKPNYLIEGHSEVANDIDKILMNFWRVLQDEVWFYELVSLLDKIPFSQVEFEEAQHTVNQLGTNPQFFVDQNVRAAACFFILCYQSRQKLQKDFATLSRTRTRRGRNEQVSAWLTAIDGLEDIHNRLQRVVITNMDAVKLIKQQDGPDTLFYIDPPYMHETRVTIKDYRCEMSYHDHKRLLDCLIELDGKMMLCGYPSQLYDDYSKSCKWRTVDFPSTLASSSKAVKDVRIERIWLNY